MAFDLSSRTFTLAFNTRSPGTPGEPSSTLPTEVFVPLYQYPEGVSVEVSDGHVEFHKEKQV
jgi:hypothetical protein